MGFHGAYNYSGLDSFLSVSVRGLVVVFSDLLDLWAEESRILRHVKPSRCEEASRKTRALNCDRSQAISALAHGVTHLNYHDLECYCMLHTEIMLLRRSFAIKFHFRLINTPFNIHKSITTRYYETVFYRLFHLQT